MFRATLCPSSGADDWAQGGPKHVEQPINEK